MCGISGTMGLSDEGVILRMVKAMYHRGPDDLGVFIDSINDAALGQTRLSINDLSSAGHQPMSYRGGRLQIVFNGEIYNFCELRSQLELLGHRFSSRCDTEVLIAAYDEWGKECVRKLSGMFAFAVLDRGATDRDEAKLFLGRDRLGIKPLYYSMVDGVFIFASEIKALIASRLIARTVDRQAIWQFLSLGSSPQPRTILADVSMLKPGHVLSYTTRSGVRIERYWDIVTDSRKEFPNTGSCCVQEISQRLRGLLEDATKRHLTADVPVGAFLSGGIDSSAVVGLMSQYSDSRIRTFSVGFDSEHSGHDELRWAKIVANRFDTDHTEVVVHGNEVAECFSDIILAIDQPSLDGTNTYLVSRAAGESVKVAVSGLGGDELFAGYSHFRELATVARMDRLLLWMGKYAREKLLSLCPGRFLGNKALYLMERSQRYETLRSLCDDESKRQLLASSFFGNSPISSLSSVYAEWTSRKLSEDEELTYVEMQGYLTNTLLRDVDAMSMAHSLEVRPVLLDYRVAEFAFSIPMRMKIDRSTNKPILVNAVKDLLPEAIVSRQKRGFELPLREWILGPLRERALSTFSSRTSRSLFSKAFLDEVVSQIRRREQVSYRVWAYLVLLEWLDMHDCEL